MLTIIQTALEAGFLYAPVAMALFLSFSILNIADMTTDGAFVLGSAVSAMMCLSGHPVLALPAGMLAAAAAGFVTAFLQTKLSVPSILAGIITNIGLYSVNLMVMGKSNQSLFQTDTIYTLAKGAGFAGSWYKVAVTALIVLALAAVLVLFLGTRLGLSIRATGDNMDMVRASSINTNFTITVGLCAANAMTGLAGAHGGPVQHLRRCERRYRHGGAGPGRPGHRRDPHRQGRDGPPGAGCGGGQHPLPPALRRCPAL